MRPILFSFGSVEISSYAVMLSLGACVGFWLSYRESLRKGYEPDEILTLTLICFVAGLVGARGVSWLIHDYLYGDRSFWVLFQFWERGGTSSFGGAALAASAGLVWLRFQKLRPWDVADLLVFAWIPFLAITRLGCFLNGCCFGRPTASLFGLVAGGEANNVAFGIPSHPTQLYALAALSAVFLLLAWLRRHQTFEGQLTVVFCALYGTFRFFHEPLRGDSPLAWQLDNGTVVSVNQLISLPLVIFALAAWGYLRRRGRPVARAGEAQT